MLFAIRQGSDRRLGRISCDPSSRPASRGNTQPCRRRGRAFFREGRWWPGDHLSHPAAVLSPSTIKVAVMLASIGSLCDPPRCRVSTRRPQGLLSCVEHPAFRWAVPLEFHRWRAGSVDHTEHRPHAKRSLLRPAKTPARITAKCGWLEESLPVPTVVHRGRERAGRHS